MSIMGYQLLVVDKLETEYRNAFIEYEKTPKYKFLERKAKYIVYKKLSNLWFESVKKLSAEMEEAQKLYSDRNIMY